MDKQVHANFTVEVPLWNLHKPVCLTLNGSSWLCIGLRPTLNICVYTVSQKKLCKLIFCQNFVKFRPIAKNFGTEIAKTTSFSEVYSFSTSPNLCQRTTMLNADVPNCYITL